MEIALFGCGRIGRMHAANIFAHPLTGLAWAYDVDAAAAEAVAREYGCEVASSVDVALSDPSLDAVLVASSTDTHVDLITRACEAGKWVLCEKPIDLSMDRVLACKQAIGEAAAKVMIGFNRRFDPSFRNLERAVRAGEIGELRQVIVTSRDPDLPSREYLQRAGGLFRDMTIHDLDLARWVLGEEPVQIAAMGAALIDPSVAELRDHDTAMIMMRTASGKQASITNYRRAVYGYDQRLEAVGDAGMLKAENQRATSLERWSASGTETKDPIHHFFVERYKDAYLAEIDDFVEMAQTGRPASPGFFDGEAALRLADAAYRSLETNAMVDIA